MKWLRRITAVAEPFDGFQMRAYRLRDTPDQPGVPLTRIEPRALLVSLGSVIGGPADVLGNLVR